MIYDLSIIGAGPGGADAAEYAAARGLSVVIFEKNKVGGVCLNEGCVPTKALLHSAHIYAKAKEGRKYAVSTSEVELDLSKLMARKNKILKKLGAGIKLGLQKHEVTLVEAEARLAGQADGVFNIEAGEATYQAKHIIIATGSEAFVPPIPGLEESGYWTAREALQVGELPKSLAVIGGGVIGMEFVSFFNTLGVEVTVVEMLPKILGQMDEELSTELQTAFAKRGVKFYLNTKVQSISNGVIYAEGPDGAVEIEAERILVSVGRRAIINGLGLETVGVATERGAVVVDEYMRTNVAGLYAVGDINGTSMLAHTATREGVIAVQHILGEPEAMSYKAIPGIVYTDPEIASVGKTEAELKAAGVAYQVHQVPMSLSGRFVIENEMVNGLCKLITDEQGVLLGAHLLGNASSEILVPAIMAIDRGMTLRELSRIVFPHPTICEILRAAALH
ncbi:dihydrolipoyl dehydrogenase [Porphyromonas sp. COT-290 OH3588]|uniref:dihydrolipoyl dehydrogenase n=1 Tax=Porphyromonas sp. COT-290 OH3588 TaxID=1515617 RepID=UPI00052BE3C7|nr:dihydrolipoyl dehydrogenase [Porphyromonas sp. COT-290 OH3588]KGN98814.1 pyridine nucleotide-disulfide oxidoreductase [Porphyromonas sp. COT-290 OH3588]